MYFVLHVQQRELYQFPKLLAQFDSMTKQNSQLLFDDLIHAKKVKTMKIMRLVRLQSASSPQNGLTGNFKGHLPFFSSRWLLARRNSAADNLAPLTKIMAICGKTSSVTPLIAFGFFFLLLFFSLASSFPYFFFYPSETSNRI